MRRFIRALATVLCAIPSFLGEARPTTNLPNRFELPPVKEPKYVSIPKYCLLSFDSSGEVKVWMIEDGKRLFVDKNANGDLTDDGTAIEPSDVRTLGKDRWDYNYVLDDISPINGSHHTKFDLRRWNYGEKEDSYGLSVWVDGKMPMYAGWFGTFWSTNRALAPIIHFGGPFTPKPLRRKVFTLGESNQRLSLCFINPGSGDGAVSRLSIDALPKLVVPKLTIDWPTAPGASPLRTTHKLTERCCYWEFYTSKFALPKGVVPGKAKLSVDLPASTVSIVLTTTEFELPVVEQSTEQKPSQ